MTDMIHKCKLIHQKYPFDFNWNVQVWHSMDGGKSYWYAGIGKFFKTKTEAEEYINALGYPCEYEEGVA